MPFEIDIFGDLYDVEHLGNLSLTRETLKHVKLRPHSSLGRKQKKTLLWLDAGVDNVPGATRNLCCLSVLSQMKSATPWIMKMNQEEDFANIGEPF